MLGLRSGINAGVMLLQPDLQTLEQCLAEALNKVLFPGPSCRNLLNDVSKLKIISFFVRLLMHPLVMTDVCFGDVLEIGLEYP